MQSGPFSVFPAAFLLEEQFQAELDVARAARAEHGIIALDIGRGAGAPELARCARIQSRGVRGGNCGIRAIKYIEELRPGQRGEPLPELPGLSYREVHVVVVRKA